MIGTVNIMINVTVTIDRATVIIVITMTAIAGIDIQREGG